MILYEQDHQVVIIRQTDHALLAGFLARQWGNEEFSRPEPFGSFRLAAAEHDNGWAAWEAHPQIDRATFLPYTFMSIPTEQHIALYQRGLDRLLQVDRYAALLASIHCVDLYDKTRATMPGFSSKYVRASETPLVHEFLQRLRLQQLRLKMDLRADPATSDFLDEKRLRANVLRLEALDRLSLYLCVPALEDSILEGVPRNDRGEEVDWHLTVQGPAAVALAPYPFRPEPLSISILVRRIPKRHYAGDADLQATLARAPYEPVQCTLKRGTSPMQSLLADVEFR
jgi:hypothetical protein